jgi:hypothetical protein
MPRLASAALARLAVFGSIAAALLMPAARASAQPTVRLSTLQAPVGDTVHVDGWGFDPSNTHVKLSLLQDGQINPTPQEPFEGCPAENGSFSCDFTILQVTVVGGGPPISSTVGAILRIGLRAAVPAQTPTGYTFRAIGNNANDMATSPFAIGPTISLSPSSGPPGTRVTITGHGFNWNDFYNYVFFDPFYMTGTDPVWDTDIWGLPLAEGTWGSPCHPDTKGRVYCTVTIPVRKPGTYPICACMLHLGIGAGRDDYAFADFQITGAVTTLTPPSGPAGTQVHVRTRGLSPQATTARLSMENIDVTPDGGCPIDGGELSCSFIVPGVPAGLLTDLVISPDQGLVTWERFSVTYNPQLHVEPGTGPPGTEVTISGTGFSPGTSAVDVVWQTELQRRLVTSCPAAGGAFSCRFFVPGEWGGGAVDAVRTIQVFGDGIGVGDYAQFSFHQTIPPSITLSQASGLGGTLIAVTGEHFQPSDTSATLTLQPGSVNLTPAQGCDIWDGSFTCSVVLPALEPGCYAVIATGDRGDRAAAEYRVPPLCLTAAPGSTRVGATVTATGSGFPPENTSVTLTIGGLDVTPAAGCHPTPDGAFTCVFTAPVVPPGALVLRAVGDAGAQTSAALEIAPGITLTPSAGFAHQHVAVAGSGFASTDLSVTLRFGSVDVSPAAGCPVNAGTFVCDFIVPADVPRTYVVAATGNVERGVQAAEFVLQPCPSGGSSLSICARLDPPKGPAGTAVQFTATGFDPLDTTLTAEFGGLGGIDIPNDCAIVEGSTSCTLVMPAIDSPGTYSLYVSGRPRGDFDVMKWTQVPRVTLTPSSGAPGTQVVLTGDGFSPSNGGGGILLGNTPLGFCPITSGRAECSFTVPNVPVGSYTITSTFAGGVVEQLEIPFVVGPSISTAIESAEPGDTVVVQGSGFSSADTTVRLSLAGVDVTPSGGCPVTDNAFSCAVVAPAAPPGCWTLTATGNGGGSAAVQFQIGSFCVSLSPSHGPPGTVVTVTGVGFAADDSRAALLFDDLDVAPNGCPIGDGALTCTFTVPAVRVGEYTVTATGDTGDGNRVPFRVDAGVTITPPSGPPGTTVTIAVSGLDDPAYCCAGFDLPLGGRISFAGPGCLLVDGAGACAYTIPNVPGGRYTVSIRGYGGAGERMTTTFDVTPRLALNPRAAPPGTEVSVTGVGFPADTRNSEFIFGTSTFLIQSCPASNGSVACTFVVPNLTRGPWSVQVSAVSDALNQSFGVYDSFLVGPQIAVNPVTGEAGTQVTVEGVGFRPADTSATIKVGLEGAPFSFVDVTPAGGCPVSNGSLRCAFTLPSYLFVVDVLELTVLVTGNSGDSATAPFGALRPIAVTWAAPADISFGTPLSGVQLNATASVSGTFSYDPPAGTLLPAGTHSLGLVFTPNDAGRSPITASVEIRVLPASQTITFAPLARARYGDPPVALSATVDSGLAVGLAASGPACRISGSTAVIVAAGTCAITASQPGDANHAPADDVTETLIVDPALLTITADDKTKPYGAPVPELTVRYSGFVNGDTPDGLDTPVALSTAATEASDVGTYAIVASSASSSDYAISYVDGVLTVTPVPLTVVVKDARRIYHQPDPEFSGTIAGAVNGDVFTATYSSVLDLSTDVGSYPDAITASVTGDKLLNYTLTIRPGTLTITPMPTTLAFTRPAFTSAVGSPATVTAVLREALAPGDPIASETIACAIGQEPTTAATDASGTAACAIAGLADGRYSVTAHFAGDRNYQPSDAAASVIFVYQPTSFVVWGGNEPNLADAIAVGMDVTFWGAQWTSQVTSGAWPGAPAFKGYADDVSAGMWSARGGNSSSPPVRIAEYIAVLVTTSATRTGSTTTGNIAAVVIVKVDRPDLYRPDPGIPATGVVQTVVY